jgi:hypothetical protein
LNVLQDYSPEYKEAYEALNHLAERVFDRGSDQIEGEAGKFETKATGGKG